MYKYLIALCLLFLASCAPSDEGPLYRVGLDPSWYPEDFMGKEPALTGFSQELLSAIGEEEGFNVEVVQAGPEFLEWGLNEGKFDAILSSLPPSLPYEGRYLFSEPYLLIGPVLIVPYSSSIEKIDDLAGKTVATMRGSSIVSFLGEKVPAIVIVSYDTPAKALENLIEGRFDAVAMPSLIAQSYIQDLYQGRLKIIGSPLNQEALRLIALPGDESLVEDFNTGLEKMRHKGTYDDLLSKWHVKH